MDSVSTRNREKPPNPDSGGPCATSECLGRSIVTCQRERGNGFDQAADIVWENVPDCADAEALDAGDFSRVDDESVSFERVVECLERIAGGVGTVEAGDDR